MPVLEELPNNVKKIVEAEVIGHEVLPRKEEIESLLAKAEHGEAIDFAHLGTRIQDLRIVAQRFLDELSRSGAEEDLEFLEHAKPSASHDDILEEIHTLRAKEIPEYWRRLRELQKQP
ncbi:MAG: hypothetical protein AAB483_04250 [Patescibacteria group bacterium]